MKWIWIGVSRTMAAFSLLSLLFGETWARGWLAWLLKHWAEVVHRIGLHLPFYASPALEKSLVVLFFALSLLTTDFIINKDSPLLHLGEKRRAGDTRFVNRYTNYLGLLMVGLSTVVDLALLQGVANPRFQFIELGTMTIIVVGSLLVLGKKSSLLTLGLVGALLAINYGANLFGLAPPPPM